MENNLYSSLVDWKENDILSVGWFLNMCKENLWIISTCSN